jgi:Domain of unknown function (DUF4286)
MILYNVTVSIDEGVHLDWLNWMKTKHVPDVMATGCFIESRISRVHGEEEGGFTFAISYLCLTEDKYDEYQDKHASLLQKEHAEKYNGKFAAFRTLLTVLEEFKA